MNLRRKMFKDVTPVDKIWVMKQNSRRFAEEEGRLARLIKMLKVFDPGVEMSDTLQ